MDAQEQADRIARLEAMIARMEAERHDQGSNLPTPRERTSTPANSAFGGTVFQPTGVAARAAFNPYGTNHRSSNPDYKEKAKARGLDPGRFQGNEKEFDNWIVKVADKLEEDNETFRKEKSRMAYLMGLLQGDAERMLEVRYRSDLNPYSCVAEMVQVLAAVYHDPNQASTARQKLAGMMFEFGPENNIHRFIAEVNSLADQARVAVTERKSTLWEHIPADLDTRLLRDSKDPNVSYETFAEMVADAAYSSQRAFEARAK